MSRTGETRARVPQASVIIATPHARNDGLESKIRKRLPSHSLFRVRSPQELANECARQHNIAFVFFPHWSWIIPPEIYERHTCVIFHMTDVPYGRGGSPLQNLIVRGHEETVLSALRCERELDAGPVFMKRPLSLAGSAEEILQRATSLMEEMILEIVLTQPEPRAQQGEAVFFKRRQPADSDLSAVTELEALYDHIRMLDADGYPAAFLDTERLHFEFSNARLVSGALEAKVRVTRRQNE